MWKIEEKHPPDSCLVNVLGVLKVCNESLDIRYHWLPQDGNSKVSVDTLNVLYKNGFFCLCIYVCVIDNENKNMMRSCYHRSDFKILR